jgi:glycosyltransferase involved in cell wall biosynthesis
MIRPRFTVVVPAFNEAGYLPRLLDSIEVARARFRGGADAIQVVVADNQSTDATAAIAAARGCRVVRVEKRCIAAARNGGAAVAAGDIVCFVDADTTIHPDTFNAIDQRMATGRFVGGAAGWTLERWSPGLICTAIVVRLLTALARVNAGVVFCRTDIFREIGGYNEARRYAEDVEFFRAMRAAGRRRGLRTLWQTGTPAVISTRKFDHHGDWHMLYMWIWIVRNRSLELTVDDYWYNERKRF